MRLNENARNLSAYTMGFRVFFALGPHLPCAHTGAYYRFDLLFSRFFIHAIMLK